MADDQDERPREPRDTQEWIRERFGGERPPIPEDRQRENREWLKNKYQKEARERKELRGAREYYRRGGQGRYQGRD